jgi:hypothetical protein
MLEEIVLRVMEPLEYYLARRRLRWAGHVSSMPSLLCFACSCPLGWIIKDLSSGLNSTTVTVSSETSEMLASISRLGIL